MNVGTLVDQDRPEAGALALYCGKCGSVYPIRKGDELPRLQDMAERCCVPNRCPDCGVEHRFSASSPCHDCGERRRFEKAEKISWRDYDGYVNVGDDYYASIDELADRFANNDQPLPAYVWATREQGWSGVDVESAIESSLEDHHEDAFDRVIALEELEAFVKAWNARQTIVSYYPDLKRAVLLDGYAGAVVPAE